MSRASELADQLEALDKGAFTSMWAREGDKAVVAELRRLDRVNAELVEANKLALMVMCALEKANDWHPNMEKDIASAIDATRAALTSATKETK